MTIAKITAPASRSVLALALTAGAAAFATPASANQQNPIGVWLDHTGRGAIEIADCAGKLCGRLVWLQKETHTKACGTQIIGDVRPIGGGRWDRGWIYDPEKKSRYDVELTPAGDKMRVTGYLGTKFLSRTMTWTRAPADLKRCDGAKAIQAALPR